MPDSQLQRRGQPSKKGNRNAQQSVGAEITTVQQSSSIEYSGPIPPPALLADYDRIVPGSAEKIIQMAVDQSKHRQDLEKIVIRGDDRRANWGMVCGFIIAISFLTAGVYLVMNGHDWAGGTISTVGLASLVAVFVKGTNARAQERREKREDH